MNLTSFSILSQYLYSPKTWIHPIAGKYKLFCTCILLLIVPLNKAIYLKFIIFIYTYLILIAYINRKYTFKISKDLSLYYILLLVIYWINNPSLDSHSIYKIKITYGLKTYYNNKNEHFVFYYKNYLFPKFLLKLIFIIYINLILMKILFLTTKYEGIILVLFKYMYKINCKFLLSSEIFISSLSLGSQFIELIMKYYNNKIISLNLKKISDDISQYQVYIFLIISFFTDIINDIKKIGFFMYSREIILEKFYIIDI